MCVMAKTIFNMWLVQQIVEKTGLPLTTVLVIAAVLVFLVFVLVLVCCISEMRR